MNILNFLILLTCGSFVKSNVVRYREDTSEESRCLLSDGEQGYCEKVSNCMDYFKDSRKNNVPVEICSFGKNSGDIVICCRQEEKSKDGYDLSYRYCRDQYLEHRLAIPDNVVAAVNGLDVVPGEFSNIVRTYFIHELFFVCNFDINRVQF